MLSKASVNLLTRYLRIVGPAGFECLDATSISERTGIGITVAKSLLARMRKQELISADKSLTPGQAELLQYLGISFWPPLKEALNAINCAEPGSLSPYDVVPRLSRACYSGSEREASRLWYMAIEHLYAKVYPDKVCPTPGTLGQDLLVSPGVDKKSKLLLVACYTAYLHCMGLQYVPAYRPPWIQYINYRK